MKTKFSPLFAAFLVLVAWAPLVAQERVDLGVVNRIRAEAFQNSKVMDHVFYLTDVSGPRVAGSPEYRKAAEWAVKTLREWGIEDAKLEKWGAFGRSWNYSRFAAHMLEPQQTSLIGVPLAWSPGTDGAVTGDAVFAPIQTMEDAEKLKGQLKGKFLLVAPLRQVELHTSADARRYTDTELDEAAKAPEPRPPSAPFVRPPGPGRLPRSKINQLLKEEGVLAVISPGAFRGDDGTIFTSPAGSRDLKEPLPPTSVALAPEHYNRIVRLLEKKIPVRLEIEVRAQVHEDSPDGMNVVGDLPGGRRKNEIVMIGAHLDSWHAGTGATDDAAGCAVMLEVLRIFRALELKMDRTVRIGLWDAEEEGLLGSKGYVKEHFADPQNMQLKSEHARLSGYFNFDNGSGKIRGVYLQGNDMMRPVFQAWLDPFKDLGVTTVSIRNTSGTDHLSFDAVGLPGFQFIQDPLDYSTRTHHTNMDVYDRVQPGDLMQASAVIASVVYHAATRPEMLPRKPLPKPQAARPN